MINRLLLVITEVLCSNKSLCKGCSPYYEFVSPFCKGLLLIVQLTAKIGQELKTKNRKIYQEKEHISFSDLRNGNIGEFSEEWAGEMTTNWKELACGVTSPFSAITVLRW